MQQTGYMGGRSVADRTFGRLPISDVRDDGYPMRMAIEQAPPAKEQPTNPFPGDYYWPAWPPLDQGSHPHCVGYAWRHWLNYPPLITTKAGPSGPEIYLAAQRIDEWPGENYAGTSVRAGAKVVQSAGHIANYYWSQSIADMMDFLRTRGTVVVGTNWYDRMSRPLPNGLIRIGGRQVGGHAYLVHGYSSGSRLFRCVNSWGSGWGQGGGFWVTFDDMARLLAEDGEACAAIEKDAKAVVNMKVERTSRHGVRK